jgi:hypothetical protein
VVEWFIPTGFQKYVDNMKEASVACFWEPTGHRINAHGDCKSSNRQPESISIFTMKSMKTKTKTPKHIIFIYRNGLIIGQFSMGDVEPANEDVVREIKRRCAEGDWGE